MIWVGVDAIWINVIQSYRIFAPNFSNSKSFSRSEFSKMLFSPGFLLAFSCTIPWRDPVIEIRRLSIKDAEAPNVPWWDDVTAIPSNSSTTPQTGNLWHYAPECSQWVHRSSVISPPPEINNNSITTFLTPEVEVVITLSLSINGSACLVSVWTNMMYLLRAIQTL